MNIARASLVEFLKCGRLGDICPGLPQPEVVALLGSPKLFQHFHMGEYQEREGFILVYNNLEVTCQLGVVSSMSIDMPLNTQTVDLPMQFSPNDLVLSRLVTQEQFEDYLQRQNLTFTSSFETQSCLLVAGRVSVIFDTDLHLDSLSVS